VDDARMRALQDAMIDPHVLLVPAADSSAGALQIAEVNPAACRYLGRDREELVGRSPESVVSQAASALLDDWRRQLLGATDPIIIDDQSLASPVTGEPRWFDVRAVQVADAVSLTWRDVSERHEAIDALAKSEARFRLLADNATDVITQTGFKGIVQWVSPSITSVLGWTPDEVVGRHFSALMHPDDFPRLRAMQTAMIQAGRVEGRMEARFARTDGTWRWMSDHGRALLDPDGTIVGGIDALRDIHLEHEARVALTESEARFRTAMDSAPSGMALVGLDRRFVEVNGALCSMLGQASDWLSGRPITDVIHPDDIEIDLDMRREVLRASSTSVTREKRLLRGDGAVIWVQHAVALVRGDDGEPVHYVCQFVDVTQSRAARGQLEFMADHDVLTGLPNRRSVLSSMAAVLAHASRNGSPLLVLYCDIDDLKPVNDTHGHAAGDQLLIEVGRRMRAALRAHDIVGRVGGDEFVALLSAVGSLDDAHWVVAKIRAAVSAPWPVGDAVPRVSIGMTLADPGEDPEVVLQRADRALYRAKAGGGDRTVDYDPEVDG
jgi:diguanylate cyclase (GGDEF)-like protein/PAS domain S-box-containing protein